MSFSELLGHLFKKEKKTQARASYSEEDLLNLFKDSPESSVVHGYKIPPYMVAKEYSLATFLGIDRFTDVVERNNSIGYVPIGLGKKLESLMYDKTGRPTGNDIYVKTTNSADRDAMFRTGVRCTGNSSSMGVASPHILKDVSLEHVVERFDSFITLIGKIKKNSTFSQGNNAIDETMILSIPKCLKKEEILEWCEEDNLFHIKPEYIVGVVPISPTSEVGDMITREGWLKEQQTSMDK